MSRWSPAGPGNSIDRAVFRVPHGCDGAATTPRPGAPAPTGHGAVGDLAEIAWDGGRLEDSHHDEFIIRLRLPNRPGELLYIPVVQHCEGGRSSASVEIPEPGRRVSEYRYLAPALRLLPRN